MKIAMIGSKGIPALFGGIERHVEEISVRLARKGHSVTVFGRKSFCQNGKYHHVNIRVLPSIQTKNLDTATNSFYSTFVAISGSFDIIHYHGIGPSIFTPLAKISSKKIVSTIHAPDYKQVKWGMFASYVLKMGEKQAVLRSDAVIAVSKLMSQQLYKKYGKEIHYIPNGANIYNRGEFPLQKEFGLEEGGYILAVGRFIVEKGFHTLIKAFRKINTEKKLVIVGNKCDTDEYTKMLTKMAQDKVIFTGFLSGMRLNRLYANSFLYVLPSLVEGLPISLIEAMSFANPVLVSDIPENLEVIGNMDVTFRRDDVGDLKKKLEKMLKLNNGQREEIGNRCLEKVKECYDWGLITDKLEKVYLKLKK
ncbi:glycosyltransferase family 4 protein [bacterium]|nr:glycosyltransferase family 4 protein [bacterium]